MADPAPGNEFPGYISLALRAENRRRLPSFRPVCTAASSLFSVLLPAFVRVIPGPVVSCAVSGADDFPHSTFLWVPLVFRPSYGLMACWSNRQGGLRVSILLTTRHVSPAPHRRVIGTQRTMKFHGPNPPTRFEPATCCSRWHLFQCTLLHPLVTGDQAGIPRGIVCGTSGNHRGPLKPCRSTAQLFLFGGSGATRPLPLASRFPP